MYTSLALDSWELRMNDLELLILCDFTSKVLVLQVSTTSKPSLGGNRD